MPRHLARIYHTLVLHSISSFPCPYMAWFFGTELHAVRIYVGKKKSFSHQYFRRCFGEPPSLSGGGGGRFCACTWFQRLMKSHGHHNIRSTMHCQNGSCSNVIGLLKQFVANCKVPVVISKLLPHDFFAVCFFTTIHHVMYIAQCSEKNYVKVQIRVVVSIGSIVIATLQHYTN